MDKKIASIDSPMISEIVNGLCPEMKEGEAKGRLELLRRVYITSRESTRDVDENDAIVLWIRKYDVTNSDRANLCVGNFAKVALVRCPSGNCKLGVTKVIRDAKLHPQRLTPARDNPNWGHPIFRGIVSERVYETKLAAQRELKLLAKQFPKTAFHATVDTLFIMVYNGTLPPKERMEKWRLRVEECDNGFIIRRSLNLGKINRLRIDESYPSARSMAVMLLGHTGYTEACSDTNLSE